MELQNKPKILAATYNPVSQTKMFTVMVDIPYMLLPELLQYKELNISYKKIEDITLQEVLDNPFVPIWTKQEKGMGGRLMEDDPHYENSDWNESLNHLEYYYDLIIKRGVHKENANRLLAPFAYTTCIISGTEWDNFFEKFCPKYEYVLINPETKKITNTFVYKSKKEYTTFAKFRHQQLFDSILEVANVSEHLKEYNEPDWYSTNKSSAQFELQSITEMLYDLYKEADWQESKYHIPFEDDINKLYFDDAELRNDIGYQKTMKISASLCSNLSYNTQDNEDALESHLQRADMLINNNHLEWFNYQAVAMDNSECQVFTKTYLVSTCPENTNGALIKSKGTVTKYKDYYLVTKYGWCQNLHGFISNRYLIENF